MMKLRNFLAFSGPSIISMVLLMTAPLIMTIYLSMYRLNYKGDLRWVGLDNYLDILTDSEFWSAFEFTFVYTITVTLSVMIFGFLIALALNRLKGKIRAFFMAATLLPFVVTPVVGTLIFSWLFQDFGYLTYLLNLIGIEIYWFSDTLESRTLIILYGIWQVTPFAAIVFFAGLQAIPKDTLESSLLDGAGSWNQIKHVVIPTIQPLILFVSMICIMDAYRLFDAVAIMTGGLNNTETLMYYNYRVGIVQDAVAKGSAVSVLTMIGIFVFLIPFLYMTYKEQKGIRQ
ncbi:sugar ABC transporter permease [Photobacterium sp. ZSDE20]|uniref:Sugar ABC transporter permease n=1 Tax=Photobacterium pectinilyticum TaxID=2906793 RepID=A0ABT1N6C6_9GAMM|nr:sugar ABC transporter permease [Photobacterium sp. ZSDE20]MCQ1060304.1 sugar ABC transporter permease [Photobacterium sp. ZSDE20]MDD1827602.1 sugar ABC transporter permease [Photobacterium sp. ZSDE20]